MRLLEIADLPTIAEPWREGDNIPWYEPGFSQRMLDEHLRQDHDAASRRFEKIDEHVCWIQQLLDGQPGKILDLCCGPGLYTHRLARLGNCCVGIDYSHAQYHQLLTECGFSGVQFFPALIGTEDTTQPDMMGIVAKKAW